MTAPAGDALSHVNFRPQQIDFKHDFAGEAATTIWRPTEGARVYSIHRRAIGSHRICMGVMNHPRAA